MKIVDQVAAWCVLAFGVIHCAFTTRAYPQFNLNAIWFLSTGLFLVIAAVLNLLRVRYAGVAPGVRTLSAATNLVLLALDLVIATMLPLKSNPQAVALAILLALLTGFSLRRPARA